MKFSSTDHFYMLAGLAPSDTLDDVKRKIWEALKSWKVLKEEEVPPDHQSIVFKHSEGTELIRLDDGKRTLAEYDRECGILSAERPTLVVHDNSKTNCHVLCAKSLVLYCYLKEKFGLFVDFEFLTEMDSWGTDQSVPVGLRKILQRKVVENGVRKKRPRTGISRGNARDAICAFKFAPSRHAFDLHTYLCLTRALCRSLVVEGSVVRS